MEPLHLSSTSNILESKYYTLIIVKANSQYHLLSHNMYIIEIKYIILSNI